MGIFDFLFGNKTKQEQERLERERQDRLQREINERIAKEREARLAENRRREAELKSMIPFVFKSNCHQRFENSSPVMGLQECIRTISVEKNTNGCRGYKLQPGDGYIVKIFNDDLGKPNMSDKPMRVVRKTETSVELRGFPIEAQSPFGWQEVDYCDYGLIVYYESGKVSKCVLHMYDRNTYIEYRQKADETPKSNSSIPSVKSIAQGAPFEFTFNNVSAVKQYYNQSQDSIKLSPDLSVSMKRSSLGGNIEIVFSDLNELKSKGIIQSNLSLSPQFSFNSDQDGNEFASAEINNSFSAMYSGKEYVSLFQITKQNGKIVSFIINNLPGDQDYYYLIIFQMSK